MRRGHNNGILFDDNKHLVGINLGSDFTSEHEWGIKGLREMFGISDTGHGLVKRTITKVASYMSGWGKNAKLKECVHLIETDKETFLIVDQYFDGDVKNVSRELSRYKGDELCTAWDEKSFGISAVKPVERQALRAVHTAMQTNDLAVWLGGGGVFKNAGLVLCIASRVPYENAQALYDADIDRDKLLKAAEDTGIAKLLELAGKRYYALSPRWVDGESVKKTKHKVYFWLNPCEQDANNHGWFFVEELELWAKGQGPCVKREKERA